jgi:hypothetical protein
MCSQITPNAPFFTLSAQGIVSMGRENSSAQGHRSDGAREPESSIQQNTNYLVTRLVQVCDGREHNFKARAISSVGRLALSCNTPRCERKGARKYDASNTSRPTRAATLRPRPCVPQEPEEPAGQIGQCLDPSPA